MKTVYIAQTRLTYRPIDVPAKSVTPIRLPWAPQIFVEWAQWLVNFLIRRLKMTTREEERVHEVLTIDERSIERAMSEGAVTVTEICEKLCPWSLEG